MIREKIKKALYENFILGEITEEKINLFFGNEKKVTYKKTYSLNTITVTTKFLTVVFAIKNEKKVILLVSGLNSMSYIYREIISTSTMKIDIISDNNWKEENKELIDIVTLISNNKMNIPKEIFKKGTDKIIGYKEEYLKSPILYLLSISKLSRFDRNKRVNTKTKISFYKNTLLLINNSLTNKESILVKDITRIKNLLFNEILKKIIRSKESRNIVLEDIEYRGTELLMNSIGVPLIHSVNYNIEDWKIFIDEFKNTFKYEFSEYVFSQLTLDELPDLNDAFGTIFRNIKSAHTRENENLMLEKIMTESLEYFNREIFKDTDKKYDTKKVKEDNKLNISAEYKEEEVIPF